jgi:hypothetical protein
VITGTGPDDSNRFMSHRIEAPKIYFIGVTGASSKNFDEQFLIRLRNHDRLLPDILTKARIIT